MLCCLISFIRAGFSLQRITTKTITIQDDTDEIDHHAGDDFKRILPYQPNILRI